jgi:ComF family protein
MTPQAALRHAVRHSLRALDTLLFPRSCVLCDTPSQRVGLCAGCELAVFDLAPPACPRCASTLGRAEAEVVARQGSCVQCREPRPRFDRALALGPYQGPLRTLCLRLKAEHRRWLAGTLADLLAERHQRALEAWLAEVPAESPPALVHVPLHWSRRWHRGYDQAACLARRLHERLGLDLLPALRRVKATPRLADRGRAERIALMRGAFRVRRAAARRLAGRDVVLVDDVLTTGSTCDAATRVLRKAGARRVLVLVLARAEPHRR